MSSRHASIGLVADVIAGGGGVIIEWRHIRGLLSCIGRRSFSWQRRRSDAILGPARGMLVARRGSIWCAANLSQVQCRNAGLY